MIRAPKTMLLCFLAVGLMAAPAVAQDSPRDIKDEVGAASRAAARHKVGARLPTLDWAAAVSVGRLASKSLISSCCS